jgi:hypothetical protein
MPPGWDWQAGIEQDRILRPVPNVTLRFLLIPDSQLTGSGRQFYATAFRCSKGKLQEVFQRHGLSQRVERLSANRIDVNMMTTPGKGVRERWSYVWDPERFRDVLATIGKRGTPAAGPPASRRRSSAALRIRGKINISCTTC